MTTNLTVRTIKVLTDTKEALTRLQNGERGGGVMGECSLACDEISKLLDLLTDRHQSTYKMDAWEVLEHVVASHPGLLVEDKDGEAIDVNGGDLVDTLSIRLNQLHSEDLKDLVSWAEEHVPEGEEV